MTGDCSLEVLGSTLKGSPGEWDQHPMTTISRALDYPASAVL
jgi:hypothetical protein